MYLRIVSLCFSFGIRNQLMVQLRWLITSTFSLAHLVLGTSEPTVWMLTITIATKHWIFAPSHLIQTPTSLVSYFTSNQTLFSFTLTLCSRSSTAHLPALTYGTNMGTYQGSSHGGRRRAVPPGTANFRPALGFKLDEPPGTNRTKICWICTNSIVFQASIFIVFAQCKFCMHYFAKDTHHMAWEQHYFLEKCSEPVHCDPFGRTAIRAPISELTPAQTLLGCARH